jgi:hypothetical protein
MLGILPPLVFQGLRELLGGSVAVTGAHRTINLKLYPPIVFDPPAMPAAPRAKRGA